MPSPPSSSSILFILESMDTDMFSLLPESVLLLIISFLPFEEAARTSILSRQWRHIWRSTKNVHFNERFFHNSNAERCIQRHVFIGFVQQWMADFHEPTLDKFSLTFSQPGDFPEVVDNCIRFALQHNVKHLVLDFSNPTWDEDDLNETHAASLALPLYIYRYRGLESLTLVSCNFVLNGFRGFYCLKELSLGWVELSLSSIRAMLENCGMLESLTLKHCWNIEHLEISGRNLRLRSLVVDNCMFLNDYFSIQVPNLKYFKYSGEVIKMIDAYISEGLEEADLDFGVESTFYDDIGDVLYQILYQLYPMRVLTVCTYMLQGIPMGEEPLGLDPRHRLRVRHLKLKTTMHDFELLGIAFLFNSCPFLEVLTIELSPGRIFQEYDPPFEVSPGDSFWFRHGRVYRFLTRTLRVVEVKGFKGTYNELYLLRHLLAHGGVMEKLHVYVSQEVGNHGRTSPQLYRLIAGQLHGFRRASHHLQITIV